MKCQCMITLVIVDGKSLKSYFVNLIACVGRQKRLIHIMEGDVVGGVYLKTKIEYLQQIHNFNNTRTYHVN